MRTTLPTCVCVLVVGSFAALTCAFNSLSANTAACRPAIDSLLHSVEATYVVRVAHADDLSTLVAALRERFPKIAVTFLDQGALWHV